jgi:DNA helicase MCM8
MCPASPPVSGAAADAPASGAQTVHENLRLSGAMLSRFDLVFLLVDQPDEALDHSLSEHVLALHSGPAPPPSPMSCRCP